MEFFPSEQTKGRNEDIHTYLQRCTKYTLKKVPKQDNISYLDQMTSMTAAGMYLCQLETNNNQNSHVIGIDCDKKVIYDCEEEYALHLNIQNLDRCCGRFQNGIKSIFYCAQLRLNVASKSVSSKIANV